MEQQGTTPVLVDNSTAQPELQLDPASFLEQNSDVKSFLATLVRENISIDTITIDRLPEYIKALNVNILTEGRINTYFKLLSDSKQVKEDLFFSSPEFVGVFKQVDKQANTEFKTPFTNQTEVTKKLIEELLNNMKLSNLPRDSKNTNKFSIAVSAQMFGSGKTYLGQHLLKLFQEHLIKDTQWANDLQTKYGESLEELSGAVYVGLDLLHIKDIIPLYGLGTSLKVLLFAALSRLVGNVNKQKAAQELGKPVDTYSLYSIIAIFSEYIPRQLFLHFDEIDVVTVKDIDKFDTGLEAVRKYYDFWVMVHSGAIEKGIPVYCSGRSFYVWLIGRHLFRTLEKGIISPTAGQAFYCQLDALSEENILQLLEHAFSDWSTEQKTKWTKLLSRYTGGVPRLLTVMIGKYLTLFGPDAKSDIAYILEWLEAHSGLSTELDLLCDVPKHLKLVFWDLLTLAVLGYPVDPLTLFLDISKCDTFDQYVSPFCSASGVDFKVPPIMMGELIRQLKFYTTCIHEKGAVGKTNSFTIIVLPELCIEYLIKHNTNEDQNQYCHLRQIAYAGDNFARNMYIQSGVWMEVVFTKTFLFYVTAPNIANSLGVPRSFTEQFMWQTVFPFFKGSFIEKLELPESVPIKQFPKVVWKGCQLLKTWPEQRKTNLSRILEEDIENNKQSLKINYLDWMQLLPLLKIPVLYKPADKSSSADFYLTVLLNGILAIVGIQVKHPEINAALLIAEYLKAKPFQFKGNFIFLVIAPVISADVPTTPGPHLQEIKAQDGIVIARLYEAGFKFSNVTSGDKKILNIFSNCNVEQHKDWEVPLNSEIILLTEHGVKCFYTERVWELMTGKQTIESILVDESTKKRKRPESTEKKSIFKKEEKRQKNLALINRGATNLFSPGFIDSNK